MEDIKAFFSELIKNFGPGFTCQNTGSCLALYGLCLLTRPEYIVEVGTSRGASTIAFAKAMIKQNKPLDRITTICRSLRHWRETTPRVQGDFLDGLPLEQIRTIESEFQDLDALSVLPTHNVLLFYDIHDTNQFYSQVLLEKWIPRIEQGSVALHDFVSVRPGARPDNSQKVWLRPQAAHFSGIVYSGYGEVAPVIWWLNQERVPIASIDGGIWFEIPWGKT